MERKYVMNSVMLIGRLARDPELSYTPNTQTAACRITLAVDRPKRNGDAQGVDYVRSADFIRITVWGRQAETCDRYLTKGRQIAVMGRIQTGSYKNRNGETVYTTDVVAERVEFLGGNNQQQSQPQVNTEEVQRQADELLRPRPQQNTQMQMESQLASGFDDLPDTFMAAEDDIPF
jgi:single-strand DNA-binding protein